MTRTVSGGLHDFNDYEDNTFVIINDFDDYEDEAWECPKCGRVYVNNIDDIVGAQRRHDDVFHRRQQEVNEAPSPPPNNSSTAQSSPSASEKIPPHIILRYAHRRAASSRNVSNFYKVLSEFYGIPVPIVEAVPTLGYEDGRKILGAWRGNTIRFAASPSLHTILHEYFHYYSFVNNGGKTSQKSTTCKQTMDDARKEELQANDFADKCVTAFEQGFDFKEEFRDLALKYHPDKGGSPRIFELVKTAYDFFAAPPALSQSYSYSPPSSDTQYRQQREHSSNSQQQNLRDAGTVLGVFHVTSPIVGIFKGVLLNLARVLPWRYWKRKKSRSAFSPSTLTHSSITKRITAKSIMFVIQMSILLADGFIIAFLTQGVLFLHYFPPSDYVMLQIGGALMGGGTVVIGMSKTHFR